MKKLKPLNFIALTFAGIINAVGITFFLSPVRLYDSGISGTSMLIAQLMPWCSLSLALLILNFPLFLYGYKKQGLAFTLYSLYAVLIYSISAFLITDVLPIDVKLASPFAGNDLLLCAIFGGIISGVGSGLTIRFGGAIDGIEVLAVIFSKGLGISVGTFVMIYNCILYIICGFILNSWILPLYSIITYAAALKTVDFVVEGITRSKAAMIITSRPTDMSRALMEAFGTGITLLDAKGGYSGRKISAMYFVVNRFQIAHMKNIVHEIDPKAYISISEVAEVFHGAIED